MATVINNPSGDSSSAAGWGIAVVLVVLIVLALIFGLPMLRDAGTTVNIPDTVDLNVNAPAAGGQ